MTLTDNQNKPFFAFQTPSDLFSGLFERVALSDIIDAKDWVDMVPLHSVDQILAEYETCAPKTNDDLLSFVCRNFASPTKADADLEDTETTPGTSMLEHIAGRWSQLTRTATEDRSVDSLLPLPFPFIVPGGRFREVYYWDTYFSMIGMPDEYAALKRDMVWNFANFIRLFGFVPNANRTYYLSRSQPPFFFMMVDLLSDEDQHKCLDALLIEHAFWMHGGLGLSANSQKDRVVKLSDCSVLNRYYDDRHTPRDESFLYDVQTARAADREASSIYHDLRAGAESGWDFSSRWLADGKSLPTIQTTNILPIDLNSILYGMEVKISSLARRAGQFKISDHFDQTAAHRRGAIRSHLWSEEAGHYCDYDYSIDARKTDLTAAALFPLFFGVANQDQIASTADAVEQKLLSKGGLLTTTVETGQQWDSPNGWAPLTWIAVAGLRKHSKHDLAEKVAKRWLETTSRTFAETGKMLEKYNVVDSVPGGGGEYPLQDGFGWTNGVTAALLKMYPEYAHFGETTFAPQNSSQRNTP